MTFNCFDMDFTTIQIGIEKNVARIALNRPDVRNALNEKMITELTEAVEWLDCRDDIRVIEICGNGKTFCAGADIQYMKRIGEYDYDRNLDDARRLSSLFPSFPVPSAQLDRLFLLASPQNLRRIREQPHQRARRAPAPSPRRPAQQRDHAAPQSQGRKQEKRSDLGENDGSAVLPAFYCSTSTPPDSRPSGR